MVYFYQIAAVLALILIIYPISKSYLARNSQEGVSTLYKIGAPCYIIVIAIAFLYFLIKIVYPYYMGNPSTNKFYLRYLQDLGDKLYVFHVRDNYGFPYNRVVQMKICMEIMGTPSPPPNRKPTPGELEIIFEWLDALEKVNYFLKHFPTAFNLGKLVAFLDNLRSIRPK